MGKARPVKETPTTEGAERALRDYRTAYRSRQASLLGRKEVFSGKAKFGIFGDGKEVAQIALAHVVRAGDFRSGYYRDQTLMFALGVLTTEQFFAQLYAHADVEADPSSGGRSMNAHFGTRLLDAAGRWRRHTDGFNSSSDVSPTGSQMPRLVGLGYASRLYRELPELAGLDGFSKRGEEIAFGTIGNASCAEGLFWESVNAIGVLRAPVLLSIWDDEYGISVPNEQQVVGGDISALLAGFRRRGEGEPGYEIRRVRGWDYPALCDTYREVADLVRHARVPAIVHVAEMTQPQGHSTSGSHERYKDAERLAWEEEFDGLRKMREWILEQGVADATALDRAEQEDRQVVREALDRAWEAYHGAIRRERDELVSMIRDAGGAHREELEAVVTPIARMPNPMRRDLMRAVLDALVLLRDEPSTARHGLIAWAADQERLNVERYSSYLHLDSAESALRVPIVPAAYADDAPTLRGFEILNRCFDAALGRDPRVVAFGQDVGKLGDVNQGFSGLQEKYGELRVSDAGIREATIVGQGIGMALRGLRPIVEIQYLDYLLYALQILSDDLATLSYRTLGGQKAPLIIRTRGHRLEGIWHSGSPMAGIIHLVRGMWVCVPRDMTHAAGFYNTLLASDEPGLIVEVLNGYRLKERLPSNVGQFTLPLGVPETLHAGDDVTLVTYGACCRIALEATELLSRVGIEVEVLDVQTLLPFDRDARIGASLRKTGRIVFLDEDVPGGTTAYMLQQVVEAQNGYRWLDGEPRTVSARAHRPAYGSDGDYWSKPGREEVFRAVYELMHETDPRRFPKFF